MGVKFPLRAFGKVIYSSDTLIQDLARITPVYKKRLLKLGIKNLKDLLYHFPHRYDDFSKIVPIGDLKINDIATVQGKVTEIKNTRTWKKRINITEAFVEDDSGIVRAIWFNQPFLADTLKENSYVSLSGKVSFDDGLFFSNPAYEKLIANRPSQIENSETISDTRFAISDLRHTGRLIPVYPETTGLTSRYLRYLMQMFLPSASQIKDWLPEETKKAQNLLNLNLAIKKIHFPDSQQEIEKARRRLAFDELFLIQLFVLQQKISWQKEKSLKIEFNEELIKEFVTSLPFKLTDSQRRAAWEILLDLQKTRPMNRLLEGDVGSGKTVVAAIAALQAMSEGWQVALMAPTEILAQQHWRTITDLLDNENFRIALLTSGDAKEKIGATSKKQKKKDLAKKVADGNIDFVIGTHALIQKNIKFKKLALVILDEQHRFGVEQRAALQKNVLKIEDGLKTSVPHLLSMTATPIPRTLALTIYGDLDISILDQMPANRQKIITQIVAPTSRQVTYEFIRQQVKQGRQVFVICPRIEIANNQELTAGQTASEDRREPATAGEQGWSGRSRANGLSGRLPCDEIKAVKEEHEKLSKKIFPDLKIGMMHGKLKAKEKEQIMQNFKNNKINILVSTSVVEVGIDIPNATVIMIEGAERFGLAQLHQFRGRVGRSEHQSYCFLFSESKNNARLKAMLTAKNGFELAEKDLEIRGPGEFFGTKQSGLPDLSMASLADIDLIKQVRLEAAKLLQKDQALKTWPLFAHELEKFQKTIHLE